MDVERLLPADPVRPIWSAQSFLVYAGGLVALFATIALIGIAESDGGDWAFVGASLVAGLAAFALAEALDRAGRNIAAGVAATLAVVFGGVFVGSLLQAIGLLESGGDGYQPAVHLVEVAIVVLAVLALRRYRAPLPTVLIALTVWLTFVDLASQLDTANAEEMVSLVVGAALVGAGIGLDRARRAVYALWLHVVGAAVAGGALVSLLGDPGWAAIALIALGYIALAFVLQRSSYAVLGAHGLVVATTMFAVDPGALAGAFLPFGEPGESDALADWQIALSYLVCGLVLGAIGVAGRLWGLPRSGPVAARE